MLKKIISSVTVLIIILAIINLGRQISQALGSGNRLDTDIEQVNSLQDQNRQLTQRLNEVESYDFLEKTARNDLNFAKDNETIVIIPQSEIEKVLNAGKKVAQPSLPNWQGWLKLIFHL